MKFDFSKIVDSFNHLNDQARYAVLVGVVLFVLLLDVFLGVLPQMTSIANVNDQIKKLSDDTQQVLVDRVRINPLKKNLQHARAQANDLNSKVRSVQEVPAILSMISSIANEYGVKIDQLTPEKTQQEVLATAPDGKYDGLPVIINARCGYHKFGHFLNKLENENLYFTLKNFIIQNDQSNPNVHLFSLTIEIILVDRMPNPSKSL